MRPFKLLFGFVPRELPNHLASWIWIGDNDGSIQLDRSVNWDLIVTYANGIEDFLSRFPMYSIVPVESISSNNFTHTSYTRRPWDFDIQNDILEIKYWVRI
jgi:hypothetical protein